MFSLDILDGARMFKNGTSKKYRTYQTCHDCQSMGIFDIVASLYGCKGCDQQDDTGLPQNWRTPSYQWHMYIYIYIFNR